MIERAINSIALSLELYIYMRMIDSKSYYAVKELDIVKSGEYQLTFDWYNDEEV